MAARARVITVSDRAAAGERSDTSGPAVARRLAEGGFEVGSPVVVPDDLDAIAAAIRSGVMAGDSLILTTGGTGLAARDVTPQATRLVIEEEVPGLSEHMRRIGSDSSPRAILSRGLAGIAASTLVINLPGSERGALESLEAVLPVLSHAVDLLAGRTDHPPA